MKKINILFWYASSKIGNSAQKIISYEKEIIQRITHDINQNGGLAGIPINIDYLDIPHNLPGHDYEAWLTYESLVNSKNYFFISGPGKFGGLDEKGPYIETISSSTSLIFNYTFLPQSVDPIKQNIIDMRSNSFDNPQRSFEQQASSLIGALRKTRFIHIANFSKTSPILKRQRELLSHNILLFNLDKEQHSKKEILEADLHEFFEANSVNGHDLVSIGLVPNLLKQNLIHSVQDFSEELDIVTGTDGNTFLNYRDIERPIFLKEESNYDVYLSMEMVLERIATELSIKERNIINRRFEQLEAAYLIKYICDRDNIVFQDQQQFIDEIVQGINNTDGIKDVYLGVSKDYSFKGNSNILKKGALVNLLLPSKKKNSAVKTLFEKQVYDLDGKEVIVSTTSFNIDVERVSNISIEEGTFSAEFYLDITSAIENPIDSVKFNNLSSMNPLHEVRQLELSKIGDRYMGRYMITSNFSFSPIPNNYPFDEQFIYIGLSSTNSDTKLQPVPAQYLDEDFKVNGWSLLFSRCGINRKKHWVAMHDNLQRIPRISEEVRLGWELKRQNSMTLLKIGIPLFFLYVLVYYTLYLGTDDSATALGYLTTAFLSGIALYFSTERPQPLSMTTIDVIFAFFYIISGVSLLMILFSQFFPELYTALIYPLRILLPASIIGLGLFIRGRLASRTFKPSITK